jgi:hypothetical protein
MQQFLLEWARPESWGKNRKIDIPQKGGVLVIAGDVTKKPEYNTIASVKARLGSGSRVREKPPRLRGILRPLAKPANLANRIVRPHRDGPTQWQTTLRLPP